MTEGIQFILYNLPEEDGKVQVVVKDETIWCTQKAMARLFGIDKSGISRHIANIFKEGELQPDATVAKIATVVNRGIRGENLFPQNVLKNIGSQLKQLLVPFPTACHDFLLGRTSELSSIEELLERVRPGVDSTFLSSFNDLSDLLTKDNNIYNISTSTK